VIDFLQSIGAKDVSTQYKETKWWLGTYDKEEKLLGKPVEAIS
jgi:hypothetical protein